jgi:hypothetical protein
MFGEGWPTGVVGPGSRGVSSGQRGSRVAVTPGKSAGFFVIPPPEGRAVMILCANISII